MQPIICTEPMEFVHIDYVGMEVTVATDKKPVVWNVLVVVDHFTQYVQAFVTKNHTARTTARVLYNNYFSVFGFPQRLMLDQGMEFCGKVIVAMCSLPHRINYYCLQLYEVPGDRVFPVLPYVQA